MINVTAITVVPVLLWRGDLCCLFDGQCACFVQSVSHARPESLMFVRKWHGFLNGGVIVEKYSEAVNLAILATLTIPFGGCIPQDLTSWDRYVLCWPTRLRESGTWSEIWGVGDLVRGLICCLTTRDSDNNLYSEEEWDFGMFVKWMMPFILSWRMSVYIFFTFSFTREIEF